MAPPKNKPKLLIDGKRLDGRGMGDLRPLKITAHVLNEANGSAYVEWGKKQGNRRSIRPKGMHSKA